MIKLIKEKLSNLKKKDKDTAKVVKFPISHKKKSKDLTKSIKKCPKCNNPAKIIRKKNYTHGVGSKPSRSRWARCLNGCGERTLLLGVQK